MVVERAYMIKPSLLGGSAPSAPPVLPTPSSDGLSVAMGLRRSQSDQLGHPQMGEPEFELAVVELLGARFGCLRVLERRCLLPVAFHRLEAVEGHAGHGAPGGAIHQQAGAAEPLERLEVGQNGRLVELNALVELVWRQLDPRRPRAGALT